MLEASEGREDSPAPFSCPHRGIAWAELVRHRTRSGVVRQHRMRGRGRSDAIDIAEVRTRRFIGGCRRRSWKAPLIRGCRRTFSPSPRGEGTSMRLHQSAAVHSCDSTSRPFAPRSGEKVVRQHRMRGRERWGAFAMQPCASPTSSAVARKARKRPSSAAAAAPRIESGAGSSPRRHGETRMRCSFGYRVRSIRSGASANRARRGRRGANRVHARSSAATERISRGDR